MLGQQTSLLGQRSAGIDRNRDAHIVLRLTGTEDYDTFALHSRRSSTAAASMANNDLEERFKGIGLADSTAKWVDAYLIFDNISLSMLSASVEVAKCCKYINQFLTKLPHLAGLLSRTRN